MQLFLPPGPLPPTPSLSRLPPYSGDVDHNLSGNPLKSSPELPTAYECLDRSHVLGLAAARLTGKSDNPRQLGAAFRHPERRLRSQGEAIRSFLASPAPHCR